MHIDALNCDGAYFLNTTSLAFATAFALTATATTGSLACAQLRDGPRGIVTQIVDGDTVILENGETVRLIGMQAPKLAKGRDGFMAWPLAEEARSALEALALDAQILLRYGGAQRDRHGRILAHGFVGADALWVQKNMLEKGLARVYSFSDNRACLDDLYRAEAKARAARVGIWSHPYYKVQRAESPQSMLPLEGRFELVEGRVLQAERAGSRIYLNFGRVWREDFTIVIERAAQKLFEKVGADPLSLGDTLIRVRGWMDVNDGPRMMVTHPEQIEVLATP